MTGPREPGTGDGFPAVDARPWSDEDAGAGQAPGPEELVGLDGPGGAAGPSTASRSEPWARVPKVCCYGAKGALVAEVAQLASAPVERLGLGRFTVQLDVASPEAGAAARPGQGRRFDWSRKISLQLMPDELLAWLALLMGWSDQMEARFHGRQRNKSLKAHLQGDGLYLDVRESSAGVPVKALAVHRTALALQALKVMKLNHPELEGTEILAVLKAARREGSGGVL